MALLSRNVSYEKWDTRVEYDSVTTATQASNTLQKVAINKIENKRYYGQAPNTLLVAIDRTYV
jgi:hypothetical protein